MPNFQHEQRLIKVLGELDRRRNEIKKFYHVLLDLQVNNDDDNQRLRDAFACSVSERRGASRQRGKEAMADFDQNMNNLFDTLVQEIHNNNHATAHKQVCGYCKIKPVLPHFV